MQVHVVGLGEVGRRFAEALESHGEQVVAVTRQQGWESLTASDGPVLVCVREEVLDEVLVRLAGVPAQRLVFVQNGWIRPLLEHLPGCTRGLVWFTSKGEFFRVLRPSPFNGPLAPWLAHRLTAAKIPATAVEAAAFAGADVEKMGFNCVVGLPLAVRQVSLGEYLERWREEAQAVFEETVSVLAHAVGAEIGPHWWEDFLASAAPLGWVRVGQAKALPLRNGAVVREAHRLGLAAPVNQRLLATCS